MSSFILHEVHVMKVKIRLETGPFYFQRDLYMIFNKSRFGSGLNGVCKGRTL